jgi:hypothetical protein
LRTVGGTGDRGSYFDVEVATLEYLDVVSGPTESDSSSKAADTTTNDCDTKGLKLGGGMGHGDSKMKSKVESGGCGGLSARKEERIVTQSDAFYELGSETVPDKWERMRVRPDGKFNI